VQNIKKLEEAFAIWIEQSRVNRSGNVLYVKRNTEARSCKFSCSGKAISVTYSECVCLASVIQHAMFMRQIIICGLYGSTKFF